MANFLGNVFMQLFVYVDGKRFEVVYATCVMKDANRFIESHPGTSVIDVSPVTGIILVARDEPAL